MRLLKRGDLLDQAFVVGIVLKGRSKLRNGDNAQPHGPDAPLSTKPQIFWSDRPCASGPFGPCRGATADPTLRGREREMIASAAVCTQPAVLRDGSAVEVRPVGLDDGPRLLAFLGGLSVDSRYRRFFSLSPDLVRTARSAVGLNRERCFGLLALTPGDGLVVGHAGYWLVQSRCAELAIAVADAYQGRGLGSLLLRSLARTGHDQGIDTFVMEVLPLNHDAIRLLARSGHPLRAWFDGGVICCEVSIS